MNLLKIFLLGTCLSTLTGCAMFKSNQIVLHPITPNHIFSIAKGTQVGDQVTTEDGYFVSQYYLNEIAEVRVK